MNIFVSDNDPRVAAANLDDKRVVKMVLETAQLLSTAIQLNGGEGPYKSTHTKHPSTIWTAQSKGNFRWLLYHGISLGIEYNYRFKKSHKSYEAILDISDRGLIKHIPDGELTQFANCTANQLKGISFKHLEDPIEAYRAYLLSRWATDTRPPKWTNSKPPEWFKPESLPIVYQEQIENLAERA